MRKIILAGLVALVFNCVTGGVLAMILGLPFLAGSAFMVALSVLLGRRLPAGSLRSGVLTEIWTGEIVKALRGKLEGSWLDGIPDASSLVNNDVIHLVDAGVDPDVLVDNTTYPIPPQSLDDADIAIQLHKFQTKVTPVTDDELYALSYDKMSRVKEAHANAINDKKFAMSAHALCPSTDGAKTPVLQGDMSLSAIVAMKDKLDGLGVPAAGRRLVLCPRDVNALLLSEQSFREQYNINRTDGTIGRLYGFDVYEYANTPHYDGTTKLAVDSTKGEACSFAFYTPRVFKATGSTKMYYSEASTDPEYQRNKINFRHYFICMPKKADSCVALVPVTKQV